jgi:translation initiation factor eIF-2B subunit gamma
LTNIIDAHVSGVPHPPALTCLMYERGAGEGTGKEREKDGECLFSLASHSSHSR